MILDRVRKRTPRGHPRAIPNRECFRVNLRDRLCCHACGRKPRRRETYHRGFEYHHVVPVRDGGTGIAENVVLLCRDCHVQADEGRLNAEMWDLTVPDTAACRHCGASISPATVEMNCSWYQCAACGERCHLYDHFGYEQTL